MLTIEDRSGQVIAKIDEDGTVLDEDLEPVVIDEDDSVHPKKKKKKKKSRTK